MISLVRRLLQHLPVHTCREFSSGHGADAADGYQERSNVPAAQAARTAEGDPHYDADEGLQTFIIIDVYCDDDARPLRQL